MMKRAVTARLCPTQEVLPLRTRYREEMNCQIVHDSIHQREGWMFWLMDWVVQMSFVGAGFPERANRRAWARAVKCIMMKRGTIYAGMSTRGNCAIALVVTVPVIPGMKPEFRVPIETATTRSKMPRIFQITNRVVVTNPESRISPSTIQGAVIPMAMSPSPAGRANSPGRIPWA